MTIYPINWFRIIVDLERVGFTDEKIGHEIGVKSTSSVSKYKTGSAEPGHLVGEKLRALHLKHCLSKVS